MCVCVREKTPLCMGNEQSETHVWHLATMGKTLQNLPLLLAGTRLLHWILFSPVYYTLPLSPHTHLSSLKWGVSITWAGKMLAEGTDVATGKMEGKKKWRRIWKEEEGFLRCRLMRQHDESRWSDDELPLAKTIKEKGRWNGVETLKGLGALWGSQREESGQMEWTLIESPHTHTITHTSYFILKM